MILDIAIIHSYCMIILIGGGTTNRLDETAIGLIISRMGVLSPLPEYHSNFEFDMDPFLVDDATKKPVNYGQKPVDLMTEILSLYSSEGDWIFDGLSGTGMSLAISCCSYKQHSLGVGRI